MRSPSTKEKCERSSRASTRSAAGKIASAEDRERARKRGSWSSAKRIVVSEKSLEEARGELSQARSRHQALSEIHARLEGASAGTRALVATGDESLRGLVGDRIEAPAELTHALAGLLGERLEDVIATDMDRALVLLEEPERSGSGRAAVIPANPSSVAGVSPNAIEGEGVVCRLVDELRYAPEDEALVRALAGDVVVVRDAACATRLREYLHNTIIVTLGGTVLGADGRVIGGSGDEVAVRKAR